MPTGTLDSATLDEVVRVHHEAGPHRTEIDLRQFKFITSPAISQLAALCFSLTEQGRKPFLWFGNTPMYLYLERSGFMIAVADHADVSGYISSYQRSATLSRLGSQPSLVELTRLTDGRQVSPLIRRAINSLTTRAGIDRVAALRVAEALAEAGQNPFQHNEATHGFFSLQVYRSRTGPFVRFGVSDCGAGITASLSGNPANPVFEDDAAAIAYALRRHTSGNATGAHRGLGLADLVKLTKSLRGTVRVRSGEAALTVSSGNDVGPVVEQVCYQPGVHVSVVLSAA